MLLNPSFLKLYKTSILLAFFSVVFYWFFSYDLARTEHLKLIGLYIGLFVLFYLLVKTQKENIRFLTIVAFLFRFVFLFSIPNLSQDFYRFIWDGSMIISGINPYLHTPDFLISLGDMSTVPNYYELYEGMGILSSSHYSNYPPLNQLCFVLAKLFPGRNILSSVIGMRLIIIAADFGTLYFGKKLLEKLNLPVHNIFWYILNPFIIIELTGNLHFEGAMIFFMIWSLYILHKGNWKMSAVVFACSVSVKLIPLILLPLFYQWFVKGNVIGSSKKQFVSKVEISSSLTPRNDELNRIKRLIGFYVIIGFVTVLSFAPFYSTQFINNYTETVGLWFQSFEFNASLYYVAREIGFAFTGYNQIAVIGKIIPVVVILFVLIITFFRMNKTTIQLITAMLLVLSFYYFTSTTVHPWYIATLLILGIFTNYKFPLVWSFVILLSYLAYANSDNTENLWIIGMEYGIVYSVFVWELFLRKKITT